jgi:hypothetical protein
VGDESIGSGILKVVLLLVIDVLDTDGFRG